MNNWFSFNPRPRLFLVYFFFSPFWIARFRAVASHPSGITTLMPTALMLIGHGWCCAHTTTQTSRHSTKKPASSCSWIRLQIWKAKFPHSQNGSRSAFQRHFAYGPLSAPTQQRSKRWHVSATLIDQAGYCSRSRTIARALTTTDKRRTNRHVENRWNSRSFAATITQRIKRLGASSWWRRRART